ncbi:InlB B-repeat-containing protein, partial [Methanimicrococcus hacksteinii]|uniref:InlB B-repeat-containing protein n=1 Tax=Methanimicrococcus hacksteinii TaxID=3028293 RepID=UPI00298ED3C9
MTEKQALRRNAVFTAFIMISVLATALFLVPSLSAGDEVIATVTFYADGKVYNIQQIEVVGTVSAPAAPPLPDGFVSFVGWSVDEGPEGIENLYNFSSPVNGDLNLYAQFSDKYLISFKDLNGQIYHTQLVEADAYAESPDELPDEPGHVFLYWTVENSTEIYEFDIPVNNNIILTPNFGDAYFVSFNVMKGTEVEDQSVSEGGTVSEPIPPTRESYVFKYWSTDKDADPDDLSKAYNFNDPVTKSLTLYAVWKADENNMPAVKVIVWKEKGNLPFEFDKSDPSNYVYHDSYMTNALAGTMLTLTEDDVKTGLEANSKTEPTHSQFERSTPVLIKDNGTTVVNVYYTYIVYNIHFVMDPPGLEIYVKGVKYVYHTEPYNGYFIDLKETMFIEDIWPRKGNDSFDYVYNIFGSGSRFTGWAAPPWSTDGATWVSKRITCTPDMLPTEEYDTGDHKFELKATWRGYDQVSDVYLNYMFEALPGETSSGTAGTDYAEYNGKTYIKDLLYSQPVGSATTAYNLKSIEGMENITAAALKYENGALTEITSTGAKTQFLLYDRLLYGIEIHDTENIADTRNIDNIVYGEPLIDYNIEPISRPGYKFIGWYEDAEYYKPIDLNNTTMPNHNLVLFARWETQELTATFYDKENGNILGVQYFANGGRVEEPKISDPYFRDPEKSYKELGIFKGWYYTRPSGLVVPVDFSTDNITENVSMYGMYRTEGFKITYNAAGGSGTVPIDGETYTLNTLARVKEADLTKDGLVLAGWQEESKPGLLYYPGSTIRMYGNVEFEAVYTDAATLTNLIYNANYGGTPETKTDSVMSGAYYALRDNQTFARNDYVLIGWSENADGTLTVYECGDDYLIPGGGAALYAQWAYQPNNLTVTYDSNGGSGTVPADNNQYSYNAPVIVQAGSDLYQVGFELTGWNTNADGSGTAYAANQQFNIIANMTLYAQWTTNSEKFTVTYGPNGGLDSPDDDKQYEYDELVTVKSNETMYFAGNVFVDWNTETDGTGDAYYPNDTFRIRNNIDLYAQWTPVNETHVLEYHPNGGEGGHNVTDIKYDATLNVLNAAEANVSYVGFDFIGWNEDSSAAAADPIFDPGMPVRINDNLTLYAVWAQNTTTYNVTYNPNGGEGGDTIEDIQIGTNHTILNESSLGANVSKYGFNFMGWNTDPTAAAADEKYKPGVNLTVTEDIELFAVWEHDRRTYYNVTYDANGGIGGTVSQVIPGDSHTILGNETDEADVSRYGFIFLGWNTYEDSAEADDTNYSVGSSITPAGNLTLYAVWQYDGSTVYRVTYDSNGGDGGTFVQIVPGNSHTVLDGGENGAHVSKYGFNFLGWHTDEKSTEADTLNYSVGSDITPTGDLTLYAIWKHDGQTYYNITYDANGGTGGIVSRVIPGEEHIILGSGADEANVSKYGFNFLGWNMNRNSDQPDANYAVGKSFVPGSDFTFYAVWKHDDQTYYNVTYEANGGVGSNHTEQVIPGENHTILTAEDIGISRYGYNFTHWTLVSDDSGQNYTAGAEITPADNVTLFAQWERNVSENYTVTYTANGGTGINHIVDVTPETAHTVLSAADAGISRYGFAVDIWTENDDGTGQNYTPGDTITPTDNLTLHAHWIRNESENYTVTYKANGGFDDDYIVDIVPESAHIILSGEGAGISRYGFIFLGWNTDNTSDTADDTNYSVGSSITPADNLTLYAIWERNDSENYTLTYNANGGIGADYIVEIVPETAYTVLSAESAGISRYGFNFLGWNPENASTAADDNYVVGSSIALTDNLTLYAIWERNAGENYTVTYTANGGAGDDHAEQIIPESGHAVLSAADAGISRYGFTFTEWNTDENGGGQNYSTGTEITPTDDMILYAQWTRDTSVKYTVTYKANGGIGTDYTAEVLPEESHTIASADEAGFTRAGFTFVEWNADENGGGQNYSAGTEITPTGDMILYAQWTRDISVKYTVTYKANGGIGTDYIAEVLPEESHTVASVDDAGFTRYGFTFTEWNADENGGGQNYSAGTEITPTGDMILYAQWTRDISVKYTVTYKANGGIGTDYIAEVLPEESHTVVSADDAGFTRAGFTFVEWNADENGGGQNYSAGTEITPTGDMILYAQWTRDISVKYTVTYKANGGTGADYAVEVLPEESHTVASVDDAGFTRAGFTFTEWNADESGGGQNYSAGTEITPTGDMILYAQWTRDTSVKYTVTYKANGGIGTDYAAEVLPEESHTVASVDDAGFTRAGFTFVEWNIDENGGGQNYSAGTEITPTGDMILYAQWTRDTSVKYTVTYKANGGI